MRDKIMTNSVAEVLDKMLFAAIDPDREAYRDSYAIAEAMMMRALLMYVKLEERVYVQNNITDIAGDRADEAGVNADLPF